MELRLSSRQFRNSLRVVFVTLVGSGSLNYLTWYLHHFIVDYNASCI